MAAAAIHHIPPGESLPHVPWHEFLRTWAWHQGQHVALIGPTGTGKTTLTNAILHRRSFVIFFSTKKRDDTQARLQRDGFRVANTFDEINRQISNRWILRVKLTRDEETNVDKIVKKQKEVFRSALMRAFREGGWTLVLDEVRYLSQVLGLDKELNMISLQGRSEKVTLVAGTQRPRWVPIEVFANATHMFFWRNPDANDVKRVAELAGASRAVVGAVSNLPQHHVLYYNVSTGDMLTTVVE